MSKEMIISNMCPVCGNIPTRFTSSGRKIWCDTCGFSTGLCASREQAVKVAAGAGTAVLKNDFAKDEAEAQVLATVEKLAREMFERAQEELNFGPDLSEKSRAMLVGYRSALELVLREIEEGRGIE